MREGTRTGSEEEEGREGRRKWQRHVPLQQVALFGHTFSTLSAFLALSCGLQQLSLHLLTVGNS